MPKPGLEYVTAVPMVPIQTGTAWFLWGVVGLLHKVILVSCMFRRVLPFCTKDPDLVLKRYIGAAMQ